MALIPPITAAPVRKPVSAAALYRQHLFAARAESQRKGGCALATVAHFLAVPSWAQFLQAARGQVTVCGGRKRRWGKQGEATGPAEVGGMPVCVCACVYVGVFVCAMRVCVSLFVNLFLLSISEMISCSVCVSVCASACFCV